MGGSRDALMKLIFIALLVAFITLAYAMPPVAYIPFILLSLLMVVRKKHSELLLMLISLVVMFAVIEAFVRIIADDVFYREHERYALKTRYRPNVTATAQARFGDMVAMDPSLKDELSEPHEIVFRTDDAGFRNDKNYTNEPYIILGDSFATTIGATQADTLVSQLNAAMPGQFVSRAFPGAPKDYEANAIRFLERVSSDVKFIWFIFEGNDLYRPHDHADAPYMPGFKNEWRDHFAPNRMPFLTTRAISLLIKNAKATRRAEENAESPVITHEIAGRQVGFLKRYIDMVTAPELELRILATPEVMQRTACVFFIPDKYRVHKPWIPEGAEPTGAGLAAVKKLFDARNIPVVDLTPALQAAASQAMEDGSFVFWRDDTHWNARGIAAVVPEVAKCLKAR